MTHWNYRVLEFVDPDGTPFRQIHEVYYDAKDRPVAYAEGCAPVVGENDAEIIECLDRMRACLDKPVLTEMDFAVNILTGDLEVALAVEPADVSGPEETCET